MAIEFLHDIEGQSARFRKSASDQQSNADSSSVPSTSQPEVIRIEGNYTDGKYTTEIVKLDRGGNLPLYIRQSTGTANSFSNIMRIGHHSNSSHQLEVFGTVKATHFYGDGSNLTGVTATPTAHNHDDRYYTETEMKTFFKRGYIEKETDANLAVGWYTIAINTGDRALGTFQIWDTASSDHQSVIFNASHHFGTDTSNSINVLANSRFSGTNFRYIRIKDAGTYDGAALQVYIDGATNNVGAAIVGGNAQENGWKLVDWIADANDPGVSVSGNSSGGSSSSNWTSFTEKTKVDLDLIINGGLLTTGEIYAGGKTSQYKVWHSNNLTPFDGDYNSLTNKPTIPSMPTDFVSKANGGTFSGNVSIFPNASTGTFRVGRYAGQEFKLHATDTINTITSINDADENQTHNFILDREHAGTGDDNFIIQKDGAAQLTIDKNAAATFAGDIIGSGNLFLRSYNTSGEGIFFRDGFEFGDSNPYNLSITILDDGDSSSDALEINAYDGIYFNTGSGTQNIRAKIDSSGLATFYGGVNVSGVVKASDGTAGAPAYSFTGDTNTGIFKNVYSGTQMQLNISVDGSTRASFNSAGITSQANVYSASGSSFRNYSGVWKGTTGVTGNGFEFTNSVDGTAMTLSSTGNAVFTGSVTAKGGSSASATALTVGESNKTQYTLQQFKTSSHGTHNAYIIAYGDQHGSQAGNFAMKNTLSGKNIFFEVDGATRLTLDASKATFANNVSIPTGSHLFFDGEGNNTYISEDIADRLRFFVGGQEFMRFTESTSDTATIFKPTTFGSDVTISGNLTVDGTTTTLNTQTVEVEDNIIVLNKTDGAVTDSPTATTSGFEVFRGALTDPASFIFDDADDTWDLSHNLKVAGSVQMNKLQLTSDTEHFVSFRTTSLVNTGTTVDTTAISGRRIDLYAYDDIKLRAGTSDSVFLMSGGSDTLTLDSSSNATFTGSATIETGINLESGVLVIKNATGDSSGLRIFQDSSDASKIYNNYNGTLQLGVGNTTALTIDSSENTTFAGDITVSKTDPTITLVDTSGANTDPNGKIVFSELSGTENFDINYNGASDRLEFRGRVGNTDNTDLVLINRDLTNTVQILGGTTISKSLTVDGADSIIQPTTTDGVVLRLHNKDNGSGVSIVVSDQNQTFTSSSCQKGQLTFRHSDSQSYGSGASWHIGSDQSTTSILLEGKVYYGEGIYTKPSSGTNIGTRKDTNWDSAYSKTNAFTTVGENFTKLGNVTVASYVRVNADESLSYLNAAQFLSAIGGMGSFTVNSDDGTDTVSGGQSLDLIGGTNITVEKSGDREFEITNSLTNNNQLTNGEGFMKASGATMTGDLMMQDENINFKSSGSSTLPQFFGHRSTTDLNDRAWENEGGWAYTTFDSNSTTSNTPSTGLHNANGLLSFNTHSQKYGHQLAMTTNTNQLWFRTRNGGNFGSWAKIWKSDNDGAASGLDADLLDGQHGSHYLDYDNLINTPSIPTNNNQLTNGAGYITSSGTINHATNLNATDDRDMAPEDYGYNNDLRIFFSTKEGMEAGSGTGTDYQDVLYLNSYSDSSGGAANCLAFDKSLGTKRILHYQASQSSTNWGTPKVLAYTDQLHTATEDYDIGDHDLINNSATVFYDRTSPEIDYYDYSKLVLGDSKVELHSPGEYIFSGDDPYIYFKKPSAGAFLNGNENVMKVGLIPSFGPGMEAVDTTSGSGGLNTQLHFVIQRGGSQYEAIKIDGKGDDTSKAQVYVKDNMSVSGKLGIGTTDPKSALSVNGVSSLNGEVLLTQNKALIKRNAYFKTGGVRLQKGSSTQDEINMRYEGQNSNNFVIEQYKSNSKKGQIKFKGDNNELSLTATRLDIGSTSSGTTYLNSPTTNIASNKKVVFLDSRDTGDGLHFKHTGTGKTVQMGMFGSSGDTDRGSFKITQGTTEANMEQNVKLEILDSGKVKLGTLTNTLVQSGVNGSVPDLRVVANFDAFNAAVGITNHYGYEWSNGTSQGSASTTREAIRIQHGSLISNTGTNQALITFRANNVGGSIRGKISGGSSGVAYYTSSDARLKEDPKDFDGLKLIGQLKPYDFKWKDPVEEDRPEWYEEQGRDYGMYAQEVKEVIPNAVDGDESTDEMMQMDYSKLVPVLVKAVQEQSAQIDALQARIKVLEDN